MTDAPAAAGAVALVSDVHGNLPALEAVLEAIDAAGVTRIWCLGDTVGYGPFVNECIALVSDRCELVLAGNHDLAVRGDLDLGMFAGSAGAGLHYALDVIDEQGRAFLTTLRAQQLLPDNGVELYHASLHDPVWEYVRDERVAEQNMADQRLPLMLVGHSHAQLAFERAPGSRFVTGGLRMSGDVSEAGEPGTLRIVNPGSVGQPRDRDPGAAWALLAPDGAITFHRVAYDIPRMRAAVEAAGLPAEIGERLQLGW